MRIEKGKIIIEATDKIGELVLTKDMQDQLIVENTSLVWSVVHKHFKFKLPLDEEDLYGYGILGLTRAARGFDPNSDTLFSSYAYRMIWGNIKVALRDYTGSVGSREERQSSKTLKPLIPFTAFEDTYSKFNSEGDCGRTAEEIIMSMTSISFEEETFDTILDDMVVEDVLKYLEDRDKEIFNLRFRERLSQGEIGRRVGLTQVSVSRRLKHIIGLFVYFKPVLV